MKESQVFLRAAATDDFLTFYVKTLPKQIRDPTSKSIFRTAMATDSKSRERVERTLTTLQVRSRACSLLVG